MVKVQRLADKAVNWYTVAHCEKKVTAERVVELTREQYPEQRVRVVRSETSDTVRR